MLRWRTLVICLSAAVLMVQLITSRDYVLQNLQQLKSTFFGRASIQASTGLRPPNPETPQTPSSSLLHVFESAAVCSDSEICSNIGKNALLRGGSAVDAALATLLCNGLIAMQSMGLGGGLLLNIYNRSEGRSYSILSREVAPSRLQRAQFDRLQDFDALLKSNLTIAVPGEVMGYAIAHERFGKLPWNELVLPTIQLCRNGYVLSKHQRDALHSNKEMVSKDKLLKQMFVDPATGEFYRWGAHIQPPQELCHTYEFLAQYGARSFYTGGLATQIAFDLQDLGSPINERDLRNFEASMVPSALYPLGAYNMHLTPPPGSGHIIGYIMNLLRRFERDFSSSKCLSALEIHRIAEALKFGFVKRWQLDTHLDEELLFNLSCPLYAKEMSALIQDSMTFDDPQNYGADLDLLSRPELGTAHISVVAANGDAVAATSSINFYFGSGRTGRRTGILFNNAVADFSIPRLRNYFELPQVKHKNRIAPGFSPMSSMAPIIVSNQNGEVRLVIGAAGGSKIISVLTQLLVRTLWMGENIKEAIDAARFHHQMLPNVLEYEYGVLQEVVDKLEAKGHSTYRYRVRGSAVCGIERPFTGDALLANADYRKDGGVAGY